MCSVWYGQMQASVVSGTSSPVCPENPTLALRRPLRVSGGCATHRYFVGRIQLSGRRSLRERPWRQEPRFFATAKTCILPVGGEFIKSRGNRRLMEPAAVLLPAIRGQADRRPRSDRIRQAALYPRVCPVLIEQLSNTTPILLTSAKSAIRGIHGTAGQCVCMPVS
jgi:hypothetical protein